MNSDYFNRHYWTYYLMLEQKLLATQNYVDFDKDNYQTYSNEYALLLQAVGAELDIIFKVYCNFPAKGRKNIKDYEKYILSIFPDIGMEKVKILNSSIVLQPFKEWNKMRNSLSWWAAYNEIKHNRVNKMKSANLKNVIDSMAGVLLMEIKLFSRIVIEDNTAIIETQPRLFIPEGVNYSLVLSENGMGMSF